MRHTLRICSGPGCLRAVKDDVRFCDECKPTSSDSDGIKSHGYGYDAFLDSLRKSTRWRRVRFIALKACPMCARCELRITAEVDHIVPAREAIAQVRTSGLYPTDANAGYFLLSNLQGLCRVCHHAKTVEDKTHIGEWPQVLDKERLTSRKVWSF
jgi:5-methylcytosine-specific restriction endonuclease McrA